MRHEKEFEASTKKQIIGNKIEINLVKEMFIKLH